MTVGIVEFDGVDLFAPELQTAKLLDGTPVRKVADYLISSAPQDDPTWVAMAVQVTSDGGPVEHAGTSYAVPAAGSYRIGLFDERPVEFSGLDGDVNRDGNPAGSSGEFAVLWDTDANEVWVDADQDADFADEPSMTDYAVHGDVGTFGVDDPDTPLRESMPFVVQTDGPGRLVNVSPATGDHGTGVASAAVGKDFLGGAFDGSAPEARLAVVRSGFFTSDILEGVLHLAKRSRADLISLSFGPASVRAFNPSRTIYSVVFDRVIDQFGVTIFAAAGNSGYTLESAGAPATTRRVVAIGGSLSPATAEALLGFPLDRESVLSFSSRGPTDDGALKPDLLAPGFTLVANPAWQESFVFGGAGYDLPPGYATYAGTSFASPMAAGAAALLVSGARQQDLPAQPDQLRQALFSSARSLPGFAVPDQGRGVLDVAGAWQVLRERPAPVVIDTAAPVSTRNSRFLSPPNTGPGLYEREGWSPGDSGQRTVTLNRKTGKGTPITYQLSLVGNDGTFTAPESITLPRRQQVEVRIGIAPATNGVHAAILTLDDPASPGIEHDVPVTVVAGTPFDDGNEFTITLDGSFPSAFNEEIERRFVTLPEDDVLAIRLTVVHAPDPIILSVAEPLGRPRFLGLFLAEGDRFSVPWPLTVRGAWELAVLGSSDFSLELSIIGAVDVSPSEIVIDPATIGASHDVTFDFRASGVGFTGHAVGTDLGPMRTDRPTLDDETFAVGYDLDVPQGATSVAARIDHPSDPAADVDLYLFDCATHPPFCFQAGAGESGTATEQVVVSSPTPGHWVAVAAAFVLPAGSTEVDYAGVAAAPSYGSIAVDDADAFHPAHSTWSRTAHVTPLASQASGPLGGFIGVTAQGDYLWGGARVELRNVGLN